MKKYLILILSTGTFLSGCAQNQTPQWSKGSFLNQDICTHMISPLDTGNEKVSSNMELTKESNAKNSIVKATLVFKIIDYRDYTIEHQENLILLTDSKENQLEIVNSRKDAREDVNVYFAPLPSGNNMRLGSISEATYKRITFKLTSDLIESMLTHKNNVFVLTNQNDTNKYVATLTNTNVTQIKQFKETCILNSRKKS